MSLDVRVASESLESRDRDVFRWLEHIEEVVAHPRPEIAVRLGGADVHAAIDLHRVDGDDLGAESLGDRDRKLGLADRGGSTIAATF